MTKKAAKSAKAPARPTAKTKAAPAESSKLAKTQLVDLVADKTGLTKSQAGQAFDALIDVTLDALKGGKTVGLPGLGTMTIKETAARTGVRPGTSEKIQIPAGKKVSFKVASTLKNAL